MGLRERVNDQIDQILAQHNLKRTPLRRKIMRAFVGAKSALSQAQVMEAVTDRGEAVDRVSIYRNLSHLQKAGILHEVSTNNYVFCSHECAEHPHLLLFCQKCQKHREIQDHEKIHFFMSLLSDFRFFGKKQPLFLRGVCSACS